MRSGLFYNYCTTHLFSSTENKKNGTENLANPEKENGQIDNECSVVQKLTQKLKQKE